MIAAAAGAFPEDELAIARELRRQARRALEIVLQALPRAASTGVGEGRLFEAVVAEVLRTLVLVCAEQRGLASRRLREGRLFERGIELDFDREQLAGLLRGIELADGRRLPWNELPIEAIGTVYETLNACKVKSDGPVGALSIVADGKRKQSGSFYTPLALTRVVVALALERLTASEQRAPRVCDPAMGAGAFLLEVWRQLAAAAEHRPNAVAAAARASACLHGVDRSWLAVAVAEASLWLLIADPEVSPRELGKNLRVGDSLIGAAPGTPSDAGARLEAFEWQREFSSVFAPGDGFDVVVGNPPWVAFAGRAAQPLEPSLRQFYARRYASWRGYPTLHGLFLERATQIARTQE